MNDGEREHAHNWLLAEDNRLFLFTFSSLALAVASLLIWRANSVDNHSVNDRPDSEPAHSAQSVLTAALSTFNITSRAPGECDLTVSQQPSTAEPSTSASTEQKPSRSKERRRRGKVPNKELVKSGKKTMAVLIATKPPASQFHDDSESLALETESKSMTNNDNVAPPTSRLHSPDLDSPEVSSVSLLNTGSPVAGESHEERYPLPACMTASTSEPVSISRQTTVTYHHSTMRSSRSQHAHPLDISHNTQPPESPCCHDDPASSIAKSSSLSLSEPSSLSLSDDSDIHERASSSSSFSQSQSMPLFASVSAHASDLGGPSQTCTLSPRTKPPRFMSKQRGADNSNGNHTISGSISTNVLLTSSATIHDSPPRITPSSSAPASSSSSGLNSGLSSPSSDSPTKLDSSPTLPHVTFPTLNPLQASANDHTHTHSSTVESPILNGKKATPPIQTASRASTPPPGASAHSGRTDSPAGPLSAQTQLASMRGALEAARLREEKARAEAECLGKENEELKWRWSEDTMAWRRREGEVSDHFSLSLMWLISCDALCFYFPATSPSPSSHATASGGIFCPHNFADSGTISRSALILFLVSDISISTPASLRPQFVAERPASKFELRSTRTRTSTTCIVLPSISRLSRPLWRCRNVASVFLWFGNAYESEKQRSKWTCRR